MGPLIGGVTRKAFLILFLSFCDQTQEKGLISIKKTLEKAFKIMILSSTATCLEITQEFGKKRRVFDKETITNQVLVLPRRKGFSREIIT